MTLRNPKEPNKKDEAPKGVREERDQTPPEAKIDFAKLDVRIENVEERINPNETNVFDK